MDDNAYQMIKAICYKMLVRSLHDRHLEDITQTVVLKYLEKGSNGNIKWLFLDALREFGLGPRGKMGARAMENSLFIGVGGDDEDNVEGDYLFNEESIRRSVDPSSHIEDVNFVFFEKEIKEKTNIELFLMGLDLNKGVAKWAEKLYLCSQKTKSKLTQKTEEMTLNILIKNLI